MSEAVSFLTEVLDFEVAGLMPPEHPFYAVLRRGADELHLSLPTGRVPFGHGCAILVCDDVDDLFRRFRARGLAISARADSPVHEAPLDQTWGTREFYIDDPSGNTLILQQR